MAGLGEVRTETAALDTRLSTRIANLDLGGFVPDLVGVGDGDMPAFHGQRSMWRRWRFKLVTGRDL